MSVGNIHDATEEKMECTVKVALVGDSQIGKSTFLVRYIEHTFEQVYIASFGLDVMEKTIQLKNCTAHLQIYDAAGQQFQELMPMALDQAKAVIFVWRICLFYIILASVLIHCVDNRPSISFKHSHSVQWRNGTKLLGKSTRHSFRYLFGVYSLSVIAALFEDKIKQILLGTKYDLFHQKGERFKQEIARVARSHAHHMRSPLSEKFLSLILLNKLVYFVSFTD